MLPRSMELGGIFKRTDDHIFEKTMKIELSPIPQAYTLNSNILLTRTYVNKLFVISGTIKQIVFKEIKILSDCFSKITVNLIVDASTEDMNEYRIQCYMSDDYLTKRIDVYLTK